MVKETRAKVLLSLVLISKDFFSPIKIDQRLQKIFDISFNEKTKGVVSGLIKEGLIKKIQNPNFNSQTKLEKQNSNSQNSGENLYELTEKGFYNLCLEFPFFRFIKDEWDGKWRIISYEIPETKREIRDRLRRQMQGWGLGPWHRSFWVTPHPIIENLRQLIGGKEEEKYFQAFEADHVFGNKEVLIEKVWQKSELDKKYRQLFKNWHDVLSKEGDKTDKLTKIIDEYVDLLKDDPGLPKQLLGENWIGFEGWNIFKEIRGILLS